MHLFTFIVHMPCVCYILINGRMRGLPASDLTYQELGEKQQLSLDPLGKWDLRATAAPTIGETGR